MLQRIQSILLLLSGVCMVVFLSTNSFVKTISESESVIVNPYRILHSNGNLAVSDKSIFYVALMAVIAAGVAIFTIFQYKNRIKQMLFVALNSLLMGASLATTVYHIKYDAITIGNAENEGTWGIGIYAAFAGLAFNWLANRFIKKDEKLVKDADRMR
jgi:hypothetical protein